MLNAILAFSGRLGLKMRRQYYDVTCKVYVPNSVGQYGVQGRGENSVVALQTALSAERNTSQAAALFVSASLVSDRIVRLPQ